ncbi:MAG: hypothetical protein V2I56_19595 [Desulfobacteraceae bacterium]|jgi:hypothetical protein|nr:hypothetical protein [Desulfobacteraceae bacterium]
MLNVKQQNPECKYAGLVSWLVRWLEAIMGANIQPANRWLEVFGYRHHFDWTVESMPNGLDESKKRLLY